MTLPDPDREGPAFFRGVLWGIVLAAPFWLCFLLIFLLP